MDFEACFFDCCQACNCSDGDLHVNLPLGILGQGDCRSSFDIGDEESLWLNSEKEQKLRSEIREKDATELKMEKLKALKDPRCDYYKKVNEKQDFPDKCNHEGKEKNNSEILKKCSNPWNLSYARCSDKQTERIHASGEPKSDDQSNSDKILAETVSELKEKVDVLYQIFQNQDQKLSTEDFEKQSNTKIPEPIFGNFWHFLNFNKRLCATEEGIEKLALILEELLRNYGRKISPPDMAYRDPLNFEEMTIGQRINFLKTRNDLLLSLMKDFLKVGSIEEIYSTLALLSKNNEVKQASEMHYKEKDQALRLNRDEILETLKNLRLQFSRIQENKSQTPFQHFTVRNEKRGGNALKYFGRKLEVISEQAELAFNNENQNINADDFRIKNNRNLKEKFIEDSDDNQESDLNLCELTSRLLAQEALLKSSLEKVYFELFSKIDTTDKNYMKENQSLINKTEVPVVAENQKCDTETTFDSSSSARDLDCIFCETKTTEKSKGNDAVPTPGKCTKYKEFKKSVKKGKNSFESVSDNLFKQNNTISNKKIDETKDDKTTYPRKILHKNNFTVISPPSRSNQTGYYLQEGCPSSREESKAEVETKDKRPVTAPNPPSKILTSSGLKPPVSQRSIKKNLRLNNVKNQNKILLSKKTSIETS